MPGGLDLCQQCHFFCYKKLGASTVDLAHLDTHMRDRKRQRTRENKRRKLTPSLYLQLIKVDH